MCKVIKYIVVTVTILSVLMSMMVIPAAAAESDAASDPVIDEAYGVVPFCIVVYPGTYTFKDQIELVINGITTTDHFLFSSNGRSYDSLKINTGDSDEDGITNILFGSDDVFDVVYNYNTVTGVGTWVDDSYRYITIDSLSPSLVDPVYFTDLSYDVGYLIYGIWTSVSDTLSFEAPFVLSTLNFHTISNFLDVYSSIYVEADRSVWYKPSTGAADCVYTSDSGWLNSSYRTLIFDTSVSSSGSVLYGVGYEWFLNNFKPFGSDPIVPDPSPDPNYTTYSGSYYYIYDYDEFWLDDTPDFSADVPGGFTCGADSSIVYNKISVSTPASDSSQSRLITFTRVDGTVDSVYSPEDLWYAEYYKQINFLSPLTISSSSALSDFLTFNYTNVRPSYAPYYIGGSYLIDQHPDWSDFSGVDFAYIGYCTGGEVPSSVAFPFTSDSSSFLGICPFYDFDNLPYSGVPVWENGQWLNQKYRFITVPPNTVVSSGLYNWLSLNSQPLNDQYSEGYYLGYSEGYSSGYNAGSSSSIGNNFFGDLFGGIGEGLSKVVLLEYPIGDTVVKVTVWSVFGTIVVIMIVVWVLKLIAGG